MHNIVACTDPLWMKKELLVQKVLSEVVITRIPIENLSPFLFYGTAFFAYENSILIVQCKCNILRKNNRLILCCVGKN